MSYARSNPRFTFCFRTVVAEVKPTRCEAWVKIHRSVARCSSTSQRGETAKSKLRPRSCVQYSRIAATNRRSWLGSHSGRTFGMVRISSMCGLVANSVFHWGWTTTVNRDFGWVAFNARNSGVVRTTSPSPSSRNTMYEGRPRCELPLTGCGGMYRRHNNASRVGTRTDKDKDAHIKFKCPPEFQSRWLLPPHRQSTGSCWLPSPGESAPAFHPTPAPHEHLPHSLQHNRRPSPARRDVLS
jgi:hypothetical protein